MPFLLTFFFASCDTNKDNYQKEIGHKQEVEASVPDSNAEPIEVDEGFEETPTRENIIRDGRVGDLMLGMPRQELENLFIAQHLRDYSTATERDSLKIVEVLNDEKTVELLLEFDCLNYCKVSKIVTFDVFYASIEGLRVGSTIADIKKFYPKLRMENQKQGSMLFAEELNGISFLLEGDWELLIFNAGAVPDSTKVRAIVVFPQISKSTFIE